jgi:subtilisin family serine protease/uncharacterized protein YjdB
MKKDKVMRVIAALMVIALVFTLAPKLPQSGAEVAAAGKPSASASGAGSVGPAAVFGKEGPSKKKSGSKDSYVKGEAIVLVRAASGAKSSVKKSGVFAAGAVGAFGKDDLPKGVKIVSKVHFDGSTSKDAAAGPQPGAGMAPAAPGVKGAAGAAGTQGSGGAVDAALLALDVDILKVKSSSLSTKELISSLRKNPKVIYAEPNYRIRALAADTFADYQWHVKNTGQDGGVKGKDIGVGTPWGAGRNGSGVVVATLDTGFDFSHEDLSGVAWSNKYQAKLAGKHGYDFANSDADPQDDAGHGTHVAGIIAAAKDNGKGASGLAPGVQIMPLKILDAGGFGDFYSAIEAYEYIHRALTLGVKVRAVNNSWGGPAEDGSEIFKAVIDRVGDKGALSVCAAGNEYREIEDRSELLPAGIESPYVISVAASTEKGELADFSNYSGELVDVAAPGASILSTVSSPVYNPLLEYAKDKNNTKSSVYRSFDDGNISGLEQADCTDGTTFGVGSAVAADGNDFFGLSGGKSVKWTIPDGHKGEIYNLYIPYPTSAGITEETPVKFHADVKISSGPEYYNDIEWGGTLLLSNAKLKADGTLPDDFKDGAKASFSPGLIGGIGVDVPQNNWWNISETLRSDGKDGEPHAVVFSYLVGNDAAHELRIDNIGVSKPNPENAYLKYAFFSGTSMSTPVVTAAVALTAQGSADYTAAGTADAPRVTRKLAAKVRSMASFEKPLAGKVKTGGILDLRTYAGPGKPFIESASISGNNVKLNGFFFGGSPGTVTASAGGISLGKITPVSGAWKDSEITLPGANLKNRLVEFSLAKGNDTAKASLYVVKGKNSFTEDEELSGAEFESDGFATDGNTLYFVGPEGTLYHQEALVADEIPAGGYGANEAAADKAGVVSAADKMWVASEAIDRKTMFPGASAKQLTDGVVNIEGGLPYVDGKFYGIAVLSAGAAAEYALACYDIAGNKWTRAADRPGAEVSGALTPAWQNLRRSTLGAYNGKLWLIGGYDGDAASRLVMVFDPAAKKWAAGPSLPSGHGRFGAVANQVGNTLLVALGGDGAKKADKTPDLLIYDGRGWSTAPGVPSPHAAQYYEKKPYFTAAVGAVADGLIFSGLAADKLGDTYTFSLSGKRYTASAYQLSQNPGSTGARGIAVGGTFYVSAETTPGYWLYDEMTGDRFYVPGAVSIFRTDAPSGLLTVSGVSKGGAVQGYGSYLPGRKVTLKAVANEGYRFKNLSVDGKAVNGDSYTFNVTKNTKADAVFEKYTTGVTLNKKSVNLKPGKSAQFKATVLKPMGGVRGVVWKSSNPKYASVSETGKVTAKKAGLGKTVVITATAKDGSGAYAKATVNIFTKKIVKLRLKAKAKKVKAGKTLKITAKFTPSKGVLRTLKWKVDKPAYASVGPTGELNAFAKGKGKTVTVTAYAKDGGKKKASIKIRIY